MPLASAAQAGSWTTYHLHDSHDGNDTSQGTVTGIAPAWRAIGGTNDSVYAEPLIYDGVVYVVTTQNTVYALNESTGALLWSLNLGTPVETSTLPCGNVGPTNGILSTPVIDQASNTLFAVAFLGGGGSPHHDLFAVNLSMRAVTWVSTADAPGSDPTVEQQRGALAFHNGTIYVPFGGLWGDCGAYHGYVVSLSASSHSETGSWITSGNANDNGSGIWAAGGPVIDSSGNVYVSTGNGDSSGGHDNSEAVAKLSPSLGLLGEWYPSDWLSLDQTDTDIGSIAPLLLPQGLVFQAGKNGKGYLLRQSNLGGMGGEVFQAQVSGLTSDACFGSPSFDGTRIYVPCNDGLYALTLVTSPTIKFTAAWHTTSTARPPVIAAGDVWEVSGTTLYGLNPANGNTDFSTGLADSTQTFSTPATADGMIFVPEMNGVEAFKISNAGPPPPPAQPGPLERAGGVITSSPDATTGFAAGRVDTVATGADGAVWHMWTNDNGLTYSWQPVGGAAGSAPALTSWGINRLDVFVRGTDGHLWHRAFAGAWRNWEDLGGNLVGAPDVTSWAPGRLDIVVRGTDNGLWHMFWNGSAWRGWENLGGRTNADPSDVSPAGGQLDVFARGTDNALWHKAWTGSSWTGWSPLGGSLTSGPDASSWGGGRVDVFGRGTDNAFWHRSWSGAWSGWTSIGGNWASDPGAASPSVGTILVFGRGQDSALWQDTLTHQ